MKHHAAVRRALKQAWELDDADKAERLMRNLARRLETRSAGCVEIEWPARLVDEILTVVRLGHGRWNSRRSLASGIIDRSMN